MGNKVIAIASEQPVENATLYDIYLRGEKVAMRLVASEGFELIYDGGEPRSVTLVDVPKPLEDRLKNYASIPWVVKEPEEEPEEAIPEVVEATEEDYIKALEELGVVFNA